MQAISVTSQLPDYPADMQTGRPSKRPRPPFGARLHALREQAGLSQQQLAEKLGITQAAYAWWERNPVALRPDQLQKLAATLNISVEELMGTAPGKKRGSGPVGKARRMFEEVSSLPRDRQQHVLRVVGDLLKANRPEPTT